ncbi:MAG: tRNA (adenosine(37)-N6)-threonylcarbamoyltransferase complex dimerization subunit type 1 TsaB [Lachnospiraceae bacterium]|nr:tRNA (adenosine(37)-N6)-threonylcarbamoyltransferase complex dimerization subunit type 1 TsaB [Lachnospiraceae bacterium]
MKILAIDSSSLVATVAVMQDDIMVAEYTINHKKTHSQTLLPMIDEIVRMAEICLDDIDAIAVSAGPGSFTGLRIGSATAKGLGLVWKKPLIHIPTVDAMAYNLYGTDKIICPIMDARRSQTYTGLYRFIDDRFTTVMAQCAISIEELALKINELNEKVIFVGDGIPVFKDYLDENLNVEHYYAPAHMNRQRAGAVAVLGGIYYNEGKTETAAEHGPDYLRQSQAERERAEQTR